MYIPPFFDLSFKSLWNRRTTAALTIFAIAVSVMLFLSVDKIRRGAQESFDNTISDTNLIVGARSGGINLLLYSVFRIGDATNNISWESYQTFANRREVAWTIPISLGDSHRGFRVMGTDENYFEHFRFGRKQALTFEAGQPFHDTLDTVIGAEVAKSLGYDLDQEIVIAHGLGKTSFAQHKDKPFRIVGILNRTGTPVDRTVHITLQGIEAVHLDWQSGAPKQNHQKGHGPHHEQDHDHNPAHDTEHKDLQTQTITAFLVKLKSPTQTLQLQRQINEFEQEPLMAILPGITLRQLWRLVGVAETALSFIASFVIFTGLLGMLTSILTSLQERRREMAILRSVGARPWHIFALLMSEAVLLSFFGSLLGLILVYGGMLIASPWIENQYGIYMDLTTPGAFDGVVVLIVTTSALLLGSVPAWLAYRQSLVDGLTVKV